MALVHQIIRAPEEKWSDETAREFDYVSARKLALAPKPIFWCYSSPRNNSVCVACTCVASSLAAWLGVVLGLL